MRRFIYRWFRPIVREYAYDRQVNWRGWLAIPIIRYVVAFRDTDGGLHFDW